MNKPNDYETNQMSPLHSLLHSRVAGGDDTYEQTQLFWLFPNYVFGCVMQIKIVSKGYKRKSSVRARIVKESFIEEVRFLLIFGDWWCLVRGREVQE